MALVAGQIGFVVVAIVLIGLVAGIGLDRLLGSKPLFTVLLVIGSGPVSLYVVMRVAMNAVAKLPKMPSSGSSRPRDYDDEGGKDE